jgi:hypothetical protein
LNNRRFCASIFLIGCAAFAISLLSMHLVHQTHAVNAQSSLAPHPLPFNPGDYTIVLVDFMNSTGTIRGTPTTKVTLVSRTSDQAYAELRQSLPSNTTQGRIYLPAAVYR